MKHDYPFRQLSKIVTLFTTVALSILTFVPIGANAQVKTWEGSIIIPSYGWENDVNPKFRGMEIGAKGSTIVRASIVYPYWMQDHLSRKMEEVTYRAIDLENEYLKITCLPELGGRQVPCTTRPPTGKSFTKTT